MNGRIFAYLLDNIVRPTAAAISAHLTYLRTLDTLDILIADGPLPDHSGAIVCVIADDEDAADAIARADPLVVFGFTLYQLHELERSGREVVYRSAR